MLPYPVIIPPKSKTKKKPKKKLAWWTPEEPMVEKQFLQNPVGGGARNPFVFTFGEGTNPVRRKVVRKNPVANPVRKPRPVIKTKFKKEFQYRTNGPPLPTGPRFGLGGGARVRQPTQPTQKTPVFTFGEGANPVRQQPLRKAVRKNPVRKPQEQKKVSGKNPVSQPQNKVKPRKKVVRKNPVQQIGIRKKKKNPVTNPTAGLLPTPHRTRRPVIRQEFASEFHHRTNTQTNPNGSKPRKPLFTM